MSEESKPVYRAAHALDRRQLLRVVGTSAGALLFAKVLTGCQQNPTGSPPNGPVSAMKVSDLKLDSLHILSSNVVIGLDSNGVYAMSAICTHAGCILDDNAQTIGAGLLCPCHGSTFDGNGKVTQGPARSALQHYQVTIAADGSITVDGSKPVAANVRVPTG
ncbi:MAG TPA: Rieske (2Fe-2S) protein [Polyangia bacterium]